MQKGRSGDREEMRIATFIVFLVLFLRIAYVDGDRLLYDETVVGCV